ncbi:MAG: emp24/gp25L/p24 family protein [Ignisphaera sp.]
MSIIDQYGNVIHHVHIVTGLHEFSFTSLMNGRYDLCIDNSYFQEDVYITVNVKSATVIKLLEGISIYIGIIALGLIMIIIGLHSKEGKAETRIENTYQYWV